MREELGWQGKSIPENTKKGEPVLPGHLGHLTNWQVVGENSGEGSKGLGHIDTFPAKSLQSCPTLCDPIDTSPPGSPVPGILQARILEWVAISFSNA